MFSVLLRFLASATDSPFGDMKAWLAFCLGFGLGGMLLWGLVRESEMKAREAAFNMGIHLGLQEARGYEFDVPPAPVKPERK